MNNKVVYIAGKITGDKDYKAKFKRYEEKYKAMGYVVFNPTILPESEHIDYEEYMSLCLTMVEIADKIIMLPDWENSKGAIRENVRAITYGKEIIYEV